MSIVAIAKEACPNLIRLRYEGFNNELHVSTNIISCIQSLYLETYTTFDTKYITNVFKMCPQLTVVTILPREEITAFTLQNNYFGFDKTSITTPRYNNIKEKPDDDDVTDYDVIIMAGLDQGQWRFVNSWNMEMKLYQLAKLNCNSPFIANYQHCIALIIQNSPVLEHVALGSKPGGFRLFIEEHKKTWSALFFSGIEIGQVYDKYYATLLASIGSREWQYPEIRTEVSIYAMNQFVNKLKDIDRLKIITVVSTGAFTDGMMKLLQLALL
ncbi:hypothetical protein BDA99DRAFT_573196 [Phascolomyces articulosus]|uniref:Uncharacterized protein n=1 Tax=Phascolomyces articulosus TaxID=60185 RepID=A0AAD5K6Z9_9FUNG|nr:hypothetical protein BDA99DRAFT_573196 [Phascolomyces articulosus]